MRRYEKIIIIFFSVLVFWFSSTREQSIWRYKVLLTLKLFSENIYFEKGSETITVGSDSKAFLAALEEKKTAIQIAYLLS